MAREAVMRMRMMVPPHHCCWRPQWMVLLHLSLRLRLKMLLRMLVMSLMLLLLLRCSPSAPPLTGSSEIATSHANQLSMFNFCTCKAW